MKNKILMEKKLEIKITFLEDRVDNKCSYLSKKAILLESARIIKKKRRKN
jgi:hypothetical protein